MKSLLLGISLLVLAIPAEGQNCSLYKKAQCNKYAKKHCLSIASLAAIDQSDIIKVIDEVSYETRYLRKVECDATGSVTYTPVAYNHTLGSFTDVKSGSDMKRKSCDPQSCCKVKCLPGKQTVTSSQRAGTKTTRT